MAGGRLQGIANLFVEGMETHALLETNTNTKSAPNTSTAMLPRDGEATNSAHRASRTLSQEPPAKKVKPNRSTGTRQEPCTSGGVRRIRFPPLDVFQREYMETATPVILTGVSKCDCAETKVEMVHYYIFVIVTRVIA